MEKVIAFLIATFQAGTLTFGGGVAFVPVMRGYYVDDYHLISNIAYNNLYIYATSTPGPIGPLITAYVGYTNFGMIGMIVGILVLIMPTTTAIIYLYPYFRKHQSHPILASIDQYIRPLLVLLFLGLILLQVNLIQAKWGQYGIHLVILSLIYVGMHKILKWPIITVAITSILYAIFIM